MFLKNLLDKVCYVSCIVCYVSYRTILCCTVSYRIVSYRIVGISHLAF